MSRYGTQYFLYHGRRSVTESGVILDKTESVPLRIVPTILKMLGRFEIDIQGCLGDLRSEFFNTKGATFYFYFYKW